jgi:hypothetical protein
MQLVKVLSNSGKVIESFGASKVNYLGQGVVGIERIEQRGIRKRKVFTVYVNVPLKIEEEEEIDVE